MSTFFRFVTIAAAGVALCYVLAFHHPVFTTKYEGMREAGPIYLRPPTTKEAQSRFRICLTLEASLLLGLYIWIRVHRRSKVGGTLKIEGEPIKGELLMPMMALENRRSRPLIREVGDKVREIED